MVFSSRSLFLGAALAVLLVSQAGAADRAGQEPAAMAARFTRQAADFRANATKHAEMAKAHRSGLAGSSKTSHMSVVQHCEKIAGQSTR